LTSRSEMCSHTHWLTLDVQRFHVCADSLDRRQSLSRGNHGAPGSCSHSSIVLHPPQLQVTLPYNCMPAAAHAV
jgi:hypothetical protein